MEEHTSNGQSFDKPGYGQALRQDIADSQYGCSLHRAHHHAVQSDETRGL